MPSKLKANWFHHFQMQWIENCYINVSVSRAYRLRLSIIFLKSQILRDITFKRKSEEKIFSWYLHSFSSSNGKLRDMNKAGVLFIHGCISAHILIQFLLELEVTDVSLVVFLAFPFLLFSVFIWLGLCFLGVEFTKTERVLFIKLYATLDKCCYFRVWNVCVYHHMYKWELLCYSEDI